MPQYLAYQARPLRYTGIEHRAGYRLKRYAISLDGVWPADDWMPALDALIAQLPQPAQAARRPGVGVLLQHRGRGADYAVLAFWDNENELALRLHVRTTEQPVWRPARDSESVCVWDLELLAFERDAYVQTLLGGGELEVAIAEYLARIAPQALNFAQSRTLERIDPRAESS